MSEKNDCAKVDSNPFQTKDFVNILLRVIESILKSVNMKKRKDLYEKDFNFLLEAQKEKNKNSDIDPFLISTVYNKLISNVPPSKTNLAKLDSILQIKIFFENKTQNAINSDPILEYVEKSKFENIINAKREVDDIKVELIELENEKNFMILQVNNRLAKISKDLDYYITTSLNHNDPVEIDKTDKRMIRSVIDATHVANSLNCDRKNKNKNNQ